MKIKYFSCLLLLLLMCCVCSKSFGQKHGQEKIDSLLNLLKKDKPDTNKVNHFYGLADEIRLINIDSAISVYAMAIALSKQLGWKKGIARGYYEIGLEYNEKGSYLLALDACSQTLTILEQIEEYHLQNGKVLLKKKSDVYSLIGNVYEAKGEYASAIEYYFKSLRIEEKLGNKEGIVRQLTNIGVIYFDQKDYKNAKNYYENALTKEREIGDLEGIARLLSNLGNLQYASQEFSEALKYYFETLKIFDSLKNQNLVSGLLCNIASVYADQKSYDKSEEFFQKALKISENTGNEEYVATILGNLGELFLLTGDYKKAEKNLIKALSISERIESVDLQNEYEHSLFELYLKMDNYEKALEHFQRATILKDSLFNEEKTKEITRTEMNYQFEKTQDSIKATQDKKDAIAKSEIQKQKLIRNSIIGSTAGIALIGFLGFRNFRNKRKREKAELSQQVSATEMKALRSQMNPHFIFNALQSIQTFLLSHRSEEANTYLLKFSKLMRAVLENSQYSEVPIKDDIQALELYMQLESIRLQHPFTYNFHIDESVDIENDTIPPLILQPFVENAIWHGLQYKPEPGHINIYLSKKDNALYAIVEDNGIGRNMSKQVAQPMLIKKESLGMKLTEERLKVLNEVKKTNAQFTVVDLFTNKNEAAGTRVELSLPLTA